MPSPATGELDQYCQLMEQYEERDDYNSQIPKWRAVDGLFCKIRESGGGFIENQATTDTVRSWQVWCHWRYDVKPKMRLLCEDGRTLDIASVSDPDGGRSMLHLHCTELVPNA